MNGAPTNKLLWLDFNCDVSGTNFCDITWNGQIAGQMLIKRYNRDVVQEDTRDQFSMMVCVMRRPGTLLMSEQNAMSTTAATCRSSHQGLLSRESVFY